MKCIVTSAYALIAFVKLMALTVFGKVTAHMSGRISDPIGDVLGAKFIFPGAYVEKPFLAEDRGYVRFYSEVGKEIKLNMRFKMTEIHYEGKLDY